MPTSLAPPTVPGALVRISADGRTVTPLPVSGLATAAHPGEVFKITELG